MRLTSRWSGNCAICAFRFTPWIEPWLRTSVPARKFTNSTNQRRSTIITTPRQREAFKDWIPDTPEQKYKLARLPLRHRFSTNRWKRKGQEARKRQSMAPDLSEVNEARRILSEKQGAKNRPLVTVVLKVWEKLEFELRYTKKHASEDWGTEDRNQLREKVVLFGAEVRLACELALVGSGSKEDNFLFGHLCEALIGGGESQLIREIKYKIIRSIADVKFTKAEVQLQESLADLSNPLDWYPATRQHQRHIHLHIGPTNSGKTYNALKRLEKAQSGIYAGPLRLLAHEVYTRLNALNKPCALITGEERRVPENMEYLMNSCTVEMVPLNAKVEVAVIDEIQMMADLSRGWAWTQALLGVQADEVHLCGELRTEELVTKLCKIMGDKLTVHKYERLSPLRTSNKSLNRDFSKLSKGDAVVLFSRFAIHAMKTQIEKETGKRCAVVYGSLPPETRAQQAALFNDPNNDYDFLVASDAIGMGLNLNIKRIIFDSTWKNDGTLFKPLATSDLKQIAGRAGRYKTVSDAINMNPLDVTDGERPAKSNPSRKASTSVGFVSSMDESDLPIIQLAMRSEVAPLKSAGIFPPNDMIIRFASLFPKETPFVYVCLRLHELAKVNPLFHMCMLKEQVNIAIIIQPYELCVLDRIIFMAAPVSLRDPGFTASLREFASCVSSQSVGHILDMKSLDIDLLTHDIHTYKGGPKMYLWAVEVLHKALTLYMWLSYRFPGVFISQALASHIKSLAEAKIDECLKEAYISEASFEKERMRRKAFVSTLPAESIAYIKDEVNEVVDDKDLDSEQTSETQGDVLLTE